MSDDGKMVAFESVDGGINQIFLYDIVNNQTTLVSRGLTSNLIPETANDHSYAPEISGDGRYIVFHSFASNLINGDNNRHADIFIYNIYSDFLTKVTNGFDRYDSNEGSFYPSINRDGTRVAFESESSNLDSNGSKTNHRQIFIFDHNISDSSGEITQITNGSGDSFDVSIDDNGSRIVFATFASDLVLVEMI